jgi:hypothetical protein
MKKEVIIAIIIGIGIGLVITFGIKTAQESLSKELQNPQPELTVNTPEVIEAPVHQIEITSPKNNSVIEKNTVSVSGTSTPFSMIGLISTTDQNATMADNQGNFSLMASLTAGVNILTLSSYTVSGEQAVATIQVVHSEGAFSDYESSPATPSPTLKVKL